MDIQEAKEELLKQIDLALLKAQKTKRKIEKQIGFSDKGKENNYQFFIDLIIRGNKNFRKFENRKKNSEHN